ncbi:lytic polysaccharide monooxygenase [Listeria sp. PSOL-1]|uniref:lytic polysaccharide monooxygenase n=1 Tax=Listeria sp. PSOL-1 TaxID=1844999 RepID=UPI0013D6A065|nr:lytic polysaccharide monooxygenase [Listeria sp. PSOL-1]
MDKMKLKGLIVVGVAFAMSVTGSGIAETASAHGFMSSPGGRAYLGSKYFTQDTGSRPVNENIGLVQYEPQSIEALKNTFIYGKIASAGIGHFSQLDEQNESRWYKTNINSGPLTVKWRLTAAHRTSTWDYYMTKPTWNKNQPLNILNFEKIASIDDHGLIPSKNVQQQINVPTDRKGYHIILAVWNIQDTKNAFYQVADVNVK